MKEVTDERQFIGDLDLHFLTLWWCESVTEAVQKTVLIFPLPG